MRIFFLTRQHSPLANEDPSILDPIRRELLARPGVQEAPSPEEADAIVINEPWVFKEWRYIDRLEADPIIGRFPHKTFTINTDDAATGLLRGIYACLPRSRFDPELHAAGPFLARPNEAVMAEAGYVPRQPRYLATWRGNPKSNSRLRTWLMNLYSGSTDLKVEATHSWLNHGSDEKQHYVRLLRDGKFSLCPAGWAPASIRIFESLALGVAPVIIADDFMEPLGPDWNSISLRIREAELPQLESLLAAHSARFQEWGERAHAAWDKFFRPDRLFPFYADALLACMTASVGVGSRAHEIERWRSREMFTSNGWSIPQRIANKVRRMLDRDDVV